MRPTKNPQSVLTSPLNKILGTEANVRVLRVALLSEIPLGTTEIARSTGLQASGIPRVCMHLEDLGVLETVGRGRGRQYRRSNRGELTTALANLFGEERNRATRVMNEVRQAVQAGSGEIRAAWIEGPVADGTDGPDDSIVVGALADDASFERARVALWSQLLRIQELRDVAIELHMYTAADLMTADQLRLAELERARPLLGAPPIELARPRASELPETPSRGKKSHADVDAQLLRLSSGIADRLRTDPSLVEYAREYIERRLLTASANERLELQEWKGILATMSVARVRRLLIRDDARGRRLRQSLPFLNVLSPEERTRLLRPASDAT